MGFAVSRGAGIPNVNVLSNVNAVPAGQWAHIALAYDESADHYAYYVNGTPESSGDAGIASLIEDTSYDLWFGSLKDDPEPRSFGGLIDEVQVWSECRTQEQVGQDMQAPVPAPGAAILGMIGIGMVGAYARKHRLSDTTEA